MDQQYLKKINQVAIDGNVFGTVMQAI